MLVKICGIRTIESAQAAVSAGADLIGLIFIPESKRKITVEIAKEIADKVRNQVKIVGLFRNQPLEEVNRIIDQVGFDYIQLQGEEDPDYVDQVHCKVIKGFPLAANFDLEKTKQEMKSYKVDYFLLDRIVQGQGEMVDLAKAKELAKEFPLFFAGGLNPENVAEVIESVQPLGVDVASGVETNGQTDIEKVKLFTNRAKETKDEK